MSNYLPFFGSSYFRAIPHNSRLTAQAPLRRLRHGICVAIVSIPFSRSFGAHEVYYAVGADALHAAGKPE